MIDSIEFVVFGMVGLVFVLAIANVIYDTYILWRRKHSDD